MSPIEDFREPEPGLWGGAGWRRASGEARRHR